MAGRGLLAGGFILDVFFVENVGGFFLVVGFSVFLYTLL
jgi:hypothetical protein